MDLSGQWRAAPLDPELTRSGADPDLDDAGWATVPVPGHWGQVPALADHPGPVLFRRRFSFDGGEPRARRISDSNDGDQRRHWLVLEGVIAQSDVWLDGEYVGATSGYFVTHKFDITSLLRRQSGPTDHVLTVEVSATAQPESRSKRTLTGTLQAGPLAPPGNPGGIWQPIRIETTGPIAIRYSRLVCLRATKRRASLGLRVVLDALDGGDVELATSIIGPDGDHVRQTSVATHTIGSGENRIEWNVTVEDPELWWPASLGDQPLYEVTVTARPTGSTEAPADLDALASTTAPVSDQRHWRTGLRTIDVGGLNWRVNGKRLFAKGITIGPQSRFLAEVDGEVVRQDLQAVTGAGLDMIRLHGHVAPPELYEEADRLGLLIWQDLPLVGGYAMNARKAVRSLARSTVDQLGHHPSVALWCAHDEPNGELLPEPGEDPDQLPSFGRKLGRHLLPSWNRSVLDPIIRRELRSADRSRNVLSRSGSLPMLADVSASDTHLWLGWHAGAHHDLAAVLKQWPRLGAFLGGFGSQSVSVQTWGELEPLWPTAQSGAFNRYVPRKAYPDGESWAEATRAYQADLIRSQVETVRRLKYRPTGGFCVVALADAEPSGGFGVLDHGRERKPAYDALVDACRPVVVIGDVPPDITSAGEQIDIQVHAVSDLHRPLGPTTVKAVARCGDWELARTWEGELGPDVCEHVGTLSFVVPHLHGPLVVDLELIAGDRVATNRYQTVVIPPAENMVPRTVRP